MYHHRYHRYFYTEYRRLYLQSQVLVMDLLPQQDILVHIPECLPPLPTYRLLLRPLAASDAEDLFAIRSRFEVAMSNYPKTPHQSVQETREWMETKTFTEGPKSIIGRHFTYVVIENGASDNNTQRATVDSKVIGYISINQVYPSPEIGYSIHPDYWGKGYATEALDGLLKMWWDMPRQQRQDPAEAGEQIDKVDEEAEKVFAICEKANLRSGRVLTKCGFQLFKEIVYEEDQLYLWKLEKPAG
ncbi:GNAT domain-containing protein [Aspergillus ambiguus]|uniref:GNAT family N-acetyltransferase n=1 Tax=Aspergillus ambiguus TaxID=176160 RepID=UPI003CCDD680